MAIVEEVVWDEGTNRFDPNVTLAGVTTDDVIIVVFSWSGDVTLSTLTADGNAMTVDINLDASNPSGNYNHVIASYKATATKSHDCVATMSSTPGGVSFSAAAFSGMDLTTWLHGTDSNDKASGICLFNIASIPDDAFVVTRIAGSSSTCDDAGVGPTGHTLEPVQNSFWVESLSHIIYAGAAVDDHDWTYTTCATSGVAAAYKAAAGGGGGTWPKHPLGHALLGALGGPI